MPSNSFSTRFYKILLQWKIILVYIPLILYWIVLFVATSIPTDNIPQLFDAQDKAEHFIAYFLLALFLNFTLHFQNKFPLLKKHSLTGALIILLAYAALDEIHQLFIPGRVCDLFDWISDGIGGSIGIMITTSIINKAVRNSEAAVESAVS